MARWMGWSIAVAVTTVVPALNALPAARADCVYFEFYVTRKNAEPIDPTPGDPCLYSTDWETLVGPSDEHTETNELPDGTPNGYYFMIGVPVP